MELIQLPRIGEVIKEYRMKQGKSQAEIAESVGVLRMVVTRWETGTRTPSAEYLIKLCAVLHIPLDAFDEYKEVMK